MTTVYFQHILKLMLTGKHGLWFTSSWIHIGYINSALKIQKQIHLTALELMGNHFISTISDV